MALKTNAQKKYLEKFDNRVSFEKNERVLYGHDIAAIPAQIKPLVGSTFPDAIVQPKTEDELVDIIRWANQEKIPVTPRGKASSGYGGVIPLKKGLVIDFFYMREIVTFDRENQTVTVQAGITFEQLDIALKKKGMTLRLYPSSYPSATVGGWLAQGGAGFGSFEYGFFNANVVSARVVLPDGTIQEFSGETLNHISDCEGITGCISQVTLRIQPLEDIEVISIGFINSDNLQAFAEKLIENAIPIWSLSFINPKMASLRNKLPTGEYSDGCHEEPFQLPETFIVTCAFRTKDADRVAEPLKSYAESNGAEILDKEVARHEWRDRFKIMKIKRLGPSLVPTEFILPLSQLGAAMHEIEKSVHHPMVKEGLIIRKGTRGVPEAVILGFIPSDQRTFGYTLKFSSVLSTIKTAEKFGGRAYATGMYFPHKANILLGTKRLASLKRFKKEIDPNNILNPGKVYQTNPVGLFIRLAVFFEPFGRLFSNLVATRIGERLGARRKDIPPDVAWYAYSCSQCGYCIDTCDQFTGRGWESQSPRGKWYWLREYLEGRCEWNQKMVDSFLACTTCGMCDRRCCAALPIESSWMKLRSILVTDKKKMTFPPFEMMAAALSSQGNIWAGYRKDRSTWFPEEFTEKHGPGTKSRNVYFAGCTASYVEQDIGQATVRLLDRAGVDFTTLGTKENCCATPILMSGKKELFIETMKKNIEAVKESGAENVICSCPACDMMWRKIYPQWAQKLGIEYTITAKHYTEILAEKIKEGSLQFPDNGKTPERVAWHDSCHMGRVSGVYDPPREMIAAMPNTTLVEMEHNREEGLCCGSVLTLIKDPPVAAELGKERLDEAIEAGVSKVLALCPCCEFQFRVAAEKKNIPIEIVDLARYVASALGLPFPDPNPEVQKQWAVFEAMINLMTPAGFADLMDTMWPELIRAMPFGMGPMMRLCGKIPGVLPMMKPMFPVLFPILLPMMLPKVMPVMLARVRDRIPMPDYMAEQMPEMMPQVMDALMPHMIHDVVPLVTQPMIDHLQGK